MQLFANKKYALLIFAVFIILISASTWFFLKKILQQENQIQKESQVLLQNQSAIFEIKKNEQNKIESNIPEDLISIMMDDAIKIYFDNSGDECYKVKGITEPRIELPKVDLDTLSNEEINILVSKKYDLVYEILKPKLTIQDYEYSYKEIDLNKDGIDEFVVEPQSLCAPGTGSLRGGTNNGIFLFYQKLDNNWKNIGWISGNGYEVLETTNENYRDLRSSWHISASCYEKTIYKWDKKKLSYKTDSSKKISSCD